MSQDNIDYKDITVDEFAMQLRADLNKFIEDTKLHQHKQPDLYPTKQWYGDWMEQLDMSIND